MAWDATAYQVTIKAIGTVESGMRYGAVNPVDPITVGLLQWYGTRAAGLLFRVKNEAPAAYDDYCPASIKTAMSSHPASDSWWNSRHVTKEEITGLANLLSRGAVKSIQNNQVATDIDEYVRVAAAWGLNKDTETLAVEFFCTVYNQSPRAASQIVANLPAKCTLDTIYHVTLNNGIVGPYRSRQFSAYNIIKNQDTAGVGNFDDDPTTPDDNDGGDGGNGVNTGGTKLKNNDHYISMHGRTLHVHHRDGGVQKFFKSGAIWIAARDPNAGAIYEGGADSPPIPVEPGGPASDAAAKVIAFARSKLLDFSYSQGPGRLNPEVSGYSDCSAFLVWVFQKAANVSLGGTYTGNLCTKGKLVKEGRPSRDEMAPGDLIFYRWGSSVRANSPFDHVSMYTGEGTRISMGRTPGPDEKVVEGDFDYALGRGGRIQVRRYL